MSRAVRAFLAALTLSLVAPGRSLASPGRSPRQPWNSENSLTRQEEATAADEVDDDEGDSASFMVVVRHAGGRSCAAALVTPRTALTSAACARPPPAAAAARRVLRVAYAATGGGGGGSGGGVAGDPWAGVWADLALLELAAPPAGARAIVMATDAEECAAPGACHVARAAPQARVSPARLDGGTACDARGPRWPGLRARSLCLSGPELCQSDRGAGVVCGGKLCGVVSRSAGAGAGARCGAVHAAAAVPRWRRFLQCAHRRGACGRDGDCAQLCRESWPADVTPDLMFGTSASAVVAVAAPAKIAGPAPEPVLQVALNSVTPDRPLRTYPTPSTENGEVPGSTATPFAPPREPGVDASPRATFEFEPNRADFRMSSARTTRVFLKAAEYGDNAAEYAVPDESAAPAPLPPASSTAVRRGAAANPPRRGAAATPTRRSAASTVAGAAAMPARLRPACGVSLVTVLNFCFLI